MLSALALLVFGLVAVALSLQLPVGTLRAPDSGFFPLALGILLSALAAGQAVQAWRAGRVGAAAPATRAPGAGAGGRALGASHSGAWRVLAFLAAVALATALLKPAGYAASSFLLVLALLRLLGERRWRVCALVAACCAVAAHVVFVQWLRIPLPVGPFGF